MSPELAALKAAIAATLAETDATLARIEADHGPAVQTQLFDDPPQASWIRPKGRAACSRDPAAGPGTCWHWWEGCPNAEKRGCYNVFAAGRARSEEAAHALG